METRLAPAVDLRRAADRFSTDVGWLDSAHSFSFGPHYDPTLLAWRANFERAWSDLSKSRDQRFYRMWRYYLLCCAGGFRSRVLQVWQFVLSPTGVPAGYKFAR